MTRSLTVHELFADLEHKLGLEWVGAAPTEAGPALTASDVGSRPDLAGFLNLIHPNKIQVLGAEELTYFERQAAAEKAHMLEQLSANRPLILLQGDKRRRNDG